MNKQTLRFTVLAGLFLVPFIPFLVSSSFFFPFITTKAFAWRVVVEIVFAAWLLLAFIEPEYRLKKSLMLYAVGSFLLVIGIADALGVNPAQSFWSNFERMEGFITMLHLGAFFVVAGSVMKEVDWRRWWNISLTASAFMVAYCLFQLAGVITINQGGVRVDGTFGNAAYLAVYMLIHIFIAMWFWVRTKKGNALAYVYLALILGQAFILYHTATRGAILGLLGGLIVVALLNLRNREDRVMNRLSVGVLAGVLIVVGGFFALRNTDFVKNSPVLARFATISTEELKTGGRSFVWPMAIKGVKERPIFGWGQDNFIYIFQKYYNPQMYTIEPWFDRAHNIFLDWMVAGGIIGLLAYLTLYAVLLYSIWKPGVDQSIAYSEKTILTGLVAAYFFHNIFVFDHLVSYILFFSLLAYIQSKSVGNVLWTKNISRENLNMFALPAVALVLALTLYSVNIKQMKANFSIISALQAVNAKQPAQVAASLEKAYKESYLGRLEVTEQISQNSLIVLTSNLPMEEKNQYFAFAKSAMENVDKIAPESAKEQIAAGSLLAKTGLSDEALKHLNKARELSPGKQDVYFEIGSAYLNNNDTKHALEAFKFAYDLAPEYREAKIIYLLGAIYAEDSALERKLLSELTEKDLIFEDRILSTYYAVGRKAEAIAILEMRKKLDPQNLATYDNYIKQINEKK